MKDKDFDDIGKRLYDLDADPPKNGWRKIGAAITQGPAGRVIWLRKHWWKPLVILIPLGVYFTISDSNRLPERESALTSIEAPATTLNATEPTDGIPADVTRDSVRAQTSGNIMPSIANDDDKSGDINSRTNSGISSANNYRTEQGTRHNNDLDSKLHIEKAEPDHPITDKVVAGENNLVEISVSTSPISNDAGITNSEGESESKDISSKSSPEYLLTETTSKNVEAFSDTLASTERIADSLSTKSETPETEEKNQYGKWRITASLSPQYVSKLVRPVATDEVLVTDIDRSGDSHKIGFAIAAGAGLMATKDLYVDAQLSYAEARQDIFFSYATGNIDTLIAVQQPDESVRIAPVYETATREISSKYGYAGIKLGVTRYFWSTARRRFNISAMAGAHYLVMADIKEKLNGNWVTLSNDDLNKINYTLMISAGYNINLNNGWELMINPALTYYLRKVKNSELPYNIGQQSLGLNFMLSKSLGRK